MNVIKRAKAPTPKFFRVLRTIGLALAAVGGTLLAAPVALPVAITTAAGYLAVAGGVISAVSQLTTDSPLAPEGGIELDSEKGQKNIRDGD
ncbi:hypothetical protein SAMN05444143_10486 [Flavobacterium succinicans]|uniref:Uncharacterized protein n=1 Tax=Flavobacterium succinicans TaxID=29536 RepID=A0A1I4V1N1_9FLAO|nr:hypothetical protein [Flavobacterium succinicans]SFM95154.1 hypothetical protein SAMN05444143_10486 [Flavobacterium succinicans]